MPTLTIEYATDAERLLLEQAVAFFADLRAVAHTAPHGTVIDACEALALTGGRKLLRDSLGHAVQARIDAADAPKKAPGSRDKGLRGRNLLTALGPVRLTRGYRVTDGDGHFPADPVVGLDGFLTAAAERMAVFAGARDSFPRASAALRELAGWTLNRESVRRLTHAAARRLSAARADRNDAARFARADGVIEVAVDAGKVNTRGGWRDVKVAVISKRKLEKPSGARDGANRKLPPPTVVVVTAGVEGSDVFAERVRAEADRLDATTADDVTVLADGAEWIWNLAEAVFPQAAGVLDFYHVAEHIADAVKAIRPAGEQADGLYAGGRTALLTGGKARLERWIGEAFPVLPAGSDGEPLRALAAHVGPHPTHLGYAGRLAEGRSIGSGQVEGAIKQLVNRRLKRTGARWRPEHVGPLVELVALVDSPDWHEAWAANAI